MIEDQNKWKSEYNEMMEFIMQIREDALRRSDELLSNKRELEYKKKQQEFMIEEQQKKRPLNISMFSPLSSEDMDDSEISMKDELQEITDRLNEAEKNWEMYRKQCLSFDRLKDFFLQLPEDITSVEETVTESDGIMDITDYSLKLLETQEMDRNRISRDLHDSTVQGLTSLIHKTEYCSRLIDKDPVQVKLELQTMIELNKEIINDMRDIIYDLRPMALSNIGLAPTLESYFLNLRRRDQLDVIFTVEGEEKELSSIVNVTLYRIIQEACNNAIRHASAKKAYVKIIYEDKHINVNIKDNGVGFDINSVENREDGEVPHFGLSTMRERAKLLKGTFELISKPGAGTQIFIRVPLK